MDKWINLINVPKKLWLQNWFFIFYPVVIGHCFILFLQYTRNQRVQQLSPFEVDILGPLFRNIGGKIKHKVSRNMDIRIRNQEEREKPLGCFWTIIYRKCVPLVYIQSHHSKDCTVFLAPLYTYNLFILIVVLFLFFFFLSVFFFFFKVEDNVFDVAPPILFFIGLVSLVKWKRKEILLHHRS